MERELSKEPDFADSSSHTAQDVSESEKAKPKKKKKGCTCKGFSSDATIAKRQRQKFEGSAWFRERQIWAAFIRRQRKDLRNAKPVVDDEAPKLNVSDIYDVELLKANWGGLKSAFEISQAVLRSLHLVNVLHGKTDTFEYNFSKPKVSNYAFRKEQAKSIEKQNQTLVKMLKNPVSGGREEARVNGEGETNATFPTANADDDGEGLRGGMEASRGRGGNLFTVPPLVESEKARAGGCGNCASGTLLQAARDGEVCKICGQKAQVPLPLLLSRGFRRSRGCRGKAHRKRWFSTGTLDKSRMLTFSSVPEPVKRTATVFLEISIKNVGVVGRMVAMLYSDYVPMTVKNFLAFCDPRAPLTYKGNLFYLIFQNYYCQTGDVVENKGFGGTSIYGPYFGNEDFTLKHKERGVLTMYTKIQNRNASQFLITFRKLESLDGQNVAFGKIVKGLHVLEAIESVGSKKTGRPKVEVYISDCDEI